MSKEQETTLEGPPSDLRRIEHVVQFQHGIRTPRRAITAPERFQAFVAFSDDMVVLTDHYPAGPFPKWNMMLKNQRIAEAQATVLMHWIDRAERQNTEIRISLAGHSNGCDINRRTAMVLEKKGRGRFVHCIIAIAGVTDPDPRKQGIAEMVERGTRLINWSSPNDRALAKEGSFLGELVRWPYSNAGRAGIMFADYQANGTEDIGEKHQIVNRTFDWGHSDYFEPANEYETFRTIARDIRQ
jgi:hypothetical protein